MFDVLHVKHTLMLVSREYDFGVRGMAIWAGGCIQREICLGVKYGEVFVCLSSCG